MIDAAPWVLLVPIVAPLLMSCLVLALPSRSLRGWLVLLVLTAAAAVSLPLDAFPAESPRLPWLQIGQREVAFQLRRGPAPLLAPGLLLLGGIGLWGASRLALPRDPTADPQDDRGAWAGALLAIAGCQLGLLASSLPAAALGAGLALAGSLQVDLRSTPITLGRSFADLALRALGVTLISAGAMAQAYGDVLTVAGCLLVVVSGALRLGRSDGSLALLGVIETSGLTPLAALLLWTNIRAAAAPTQTTSVNGLLVVGAVVFALGAVNAVTARRLREILAAQWAAQLGFLLMMASRQARVGDSGMLDLVLAFSGALVATLVMCQLVAQLVSQTNTEVIADLPPLAVPLPRSALAYLVAAASVSGLPFTVGRAARLALTAALAPAFLLPVLLAGSSLLLLGLCIPLLAFLRLSKSDPDARVAPRERVGIGLLAVLLVLGAPYRLLARGDTGGNVGATLSLQWLAALLPIMGLAILGAVLMRAARLLRDPVPQHLALPPGANQSWALPLAALGGILAPLAASTWQRNGAALVRQLSETGTSPVRACRNVGQRFYVALAIATAALIVLVVAGEIG